MFINGVLRVSSKMISAPNEIINTIKIEIEFISYGSSSKKYMSDGKISNLNTADKKILNFSIFIENKIPNIIPLNVAKKPIVSPVKKKVFLIDLLLSPNVFKMAISFVLFLIKIVRPEIILNAATTIINVRIINITFLSIFSAEKRDLFKSFHV